MEFTRITVDTNQMGGVACIRHLRIPVATIVAMAVEGIGEAEMLETYPDLEAEDIREALRYAGRVGESPTMTRESVRSRVVTVELPEEAFQHRPWSPQGVAEEMRRLWLLEEVRSRRLGFGKAAELAGVSVATFLRLMGEHHIAAFDYDDSEFDRELG